MIQLFSDSCTTRHPTRLNNPPGPHSRVSCTLVFNIFRTAMTTGISSFSYLEAKLLCIDRTLNSGCEIQVECLQGSQYVAVTVYKRCWWCHEWQHLHTQLNLSNRIRFPDKTKHLIDILHTRLAIFHHVLIQAVGCCCCCDLHRQHRRPGCLHHPVSGHWGLQWRQMPQQQDILWQCSYWWLRHPVLRQLQLQINGSLNPSVDKLRPAKDSGMSSMLSGHKNFL